MWFEPGPFPDASMNGKTYPVGFETPPGARLGATNRHALNDHTYCCFMSGVCTDGEPDPAHADTCL